MVKHQYLQILKNKEERKVMKIENLQKVNNLNAKLKENKAKLKIIENECIKLDYMRLIFMNEKMTLNDDELLATVRSLTYVHILKSIKEIKEQLKELGVEIDE